MSSPVRLSEIWKKKGILQMKKQTILCTGGCGFIGTNITLEAVKRGYRVIVMDSLIRRGTEENLKLLQKTDNVEILRGDVRNMHDFERSPLPDAIINLAANPGIPWSVMWPVYDFEVNTRGTINVLEYSRIMSKQVGHKIPVIQASTNKVYPDSINDIPLEEKETRYSYKNEGSGVDFQNGISEDFPIDASDKYHHSPYGASKLAADQYCLEYNRQFGVPVVVNRMSCIYGYHQKGVADQGWIDHFVRQVAFGSGKLDIFGDGKQVRDMLWGGDVAKLYLDELENIDKVNGKVFNIGGGNGNTLSLIESIAIIENLSGKKAILTHKDWRPADQKVYISDTRKLKEILGWQPTITPAQGVGRMIRRYKKEGL